MDEEEHEKLVFAIVRGDMELNETKLVNAVGAKGLSPAEEAEIKQSWSCPGLCLSGWIERYPGSGR